MRHVWLTLTWLMASDVTTRVTSSCGPPHILYILADDLGWADVSWNAADMHTPNLERLRKGGVELQNHYMQPACSASRVALLTGYYPYRMGLQRNEMAQYHRWRNHSLPTDMKILPEYLRCQGYVTHLVGKWQMGFCNWAYTPTQRGFETFYGTYGGNSDHFTHVPDVGGYDFRDNLNVDRSAEGKYSTDLYTQRTVNIIREHHECNDTRPLFIYLAYEAPHVPVQAPKSYINKYCKDVTDGERRVRCGMMAALDEGVGQVMSTLEELNYDDNLLVVFTSDNGAPGQQGGSNWPLRGKKRGAYEGGVRVPTLLYSTTLLPSRPYAYRGLLHATDWLPTLLRVAGAGDKAGVLEADRDGYDQWSSIRRNQPSPRTHLVVDMDETEGYGAVRIGDWKLVKDPSAKCWGWFNPLADPSESRPKKMKCGDYLLFDLSSDPYETKDLSAENPAKLKELKKFFEESLKEAGPMPNIQNITASFPENWGGAWSPGWC